MNKFCKSKETGINSKYIDQVAKAETEITERSGVISMYGERWEARAENGHVIPQGSDVKILRNESIIMYVTSVTK
jgi:membrane-bound ClpP family serine protease